MLKLKDDEDYPENIMYMLHPAARTLTKRARLKAKVGIKNKVREIKPKTVVINAKGDVSYGL